MSQILSRGFRPERRVVYSLREDPPLERIVRPFETPRGWPIPRRLPPEQDEQEALLMWGANISVTVTTLDAQFVNTRAWGTRLRRDNPGSEGEEEEGGVILNEINRRTSTVRVENPQDPNQWVDVERVDQITFQGEGGERTYVLRNPEPPQVPPVIYP